MGEVLDLILTIEIIHKPLNSLIIYAKKPKNKRNILLFKLDFY